MNIFAERFKEVRKAKRMKCRELSRVSGIAISQLSHYECGRRLPNMDNLRKLADALGCSCDYLTGLSNDPKYFHFGYRKMLEVCNT